uniref:Ycf1 n=1 Tax=Pellia epiphylla TaxID=40340 RepID=UPI002580B640|nr:Ycf1 [Pellia epiphylla]WIA67524.1 Ycf1 [Pellia epiphylla var. borealis]WIA67962.1 Ycf1 [Pellia epiphylla]WIA68047.1 Ycf1 [Pellia epiphylla]WIA68133.1 Ycf1 [Pellia epiphylla]WIA68477.1 Ycf1 [Pellia epiphylla]
MVLISQAQVLQRIWGVKTSNRSYLRCLSKFHTSHLFIKNNFKTFLYRQGVFGHMVRNSREENWEKWLNCFDRYNPPPKVWYGIAPREWRFRVSKYWGGDKNRIFGTADNPSISHRNREFYGDPSLKQTDKRNKLFRNNLLLHSYFDLDKDSINEEKFSGSDKDLMYRDIVIINGMNGFSNTSSGRKEHFFISEKNIFFEYNILLWLIPEFMERRHLNGKILDPETSVATNKNQKILRNPELLRGRETNQSIRRWRWKSRNLEKRFRRLGNTASLMTFVQNQKTTISLSGKMQEDLNLFHLFFRRNGGMDELITNSEHRLPRLLDDQIVMYKVVSTSLKFEQRLEKILDEYSPGILESGDSEETNLFLFHSFNIEDILLPKRRREFRILNSLSWEDKNGKSRMKGQNKKIGMNKNRIIKRFTWSSYRFEDLACMNRFWFGTMNGSRFSILRFRMYPRG